MYRFQTLNGNKNLFLVTAWNNYVYAKSNESYEAMTGTCVAKTLSLSQNTALSNVQVCSTGYKSTKLRNRSITIPLHVDSKIGHMGHGNITLVYHAETFQHVK